MLEKIYTIPVNEAFDACVRGEKPGEGGCPFCRLYHKLENDQLEIILGASMMEPDVRMATNEQGFCRTHYDMMFARRNRLGMALILESHLDTLGENMAGNLIGRMLHGSDAAITERVEKLEKNCYICNRIAQSMEKMVENAVYLWESEREFREKLSAQDYFCLPHYKRFLETGRAKLSKKIFPDFRTACAEVVDPYFASLRGDVKHFIKKFDYRYEEEPWGNAKDSVERAMHFLTGDPAKTKKSE